ncbi:MAG TPA: Rid family detoxifying hydrolase [Elusimicrobiota bacterium]|jgi:2-iminobutanoate/2-iminopropanoate deaminase|nr:Rid family detoxifying hydrolase [Elusimicrobiota bacterium]
MKPTAVITGKAPEAIGPYSQGLSSGQLVFVSGQVPLRPDGAAEGGGVAEHTRRCLENVREVLAAAGLMMDDVVKTTVFMTDLGQFAAMNEAYGRCFRPPYPARSTVQVSALPKGADVEIEAVAARP